MVNSLSLVAVRRMAGSPPRKWQQAGADAGAGQSALEAGLSPSFQERVLASVLIGRVPRLLATSGSGRTWKHPPCPGYLGTSLGTFPETMAFVIAYSSGDCHVCLSEMTLFCSLLLSKTH